MRKKKRNSVIENVIIVILIVLVVIVFGVNLLFFNASSAPSLFGKKVYITNVSDIQGISANSAVISDASAVDELTSGNVVLIFTGNETEKSVLRIQQIDTEEDGNTYYYVKNDVADSSSIKIGKDNVIAKCEWSSPELGKFITFSKSNMGIVLLLILPCIILILIQSMHLLASKKDLSDAQDDDFDDVIDYDEKTGETLNDNALINNSPLFDPALNESSEKQSDKLADIADNFANKNGTDSQPEFKNTDTFGLFGDNSEPIDFSDEISEINNAFVPENDVPANNESEIPPEDEIVYINDNSVSAATEEPIEQIASVDEIVYLDESQETSDLEDVKVVEPPKSEPPKKKVVKRVVKKRRPVSNSSAAQKKTTPPKSKYSAESIDELLKSIEEEKAKLK